MQKHLSLNKFRRIFQKSSDFSDLSIHNLTSFACFYMRYFRHSVPKNRWLQTRLRSYSALLDPLARFWERAPGERWEENKGGKEKQKRKKGREGKGRGREGRWGVGEAEGVGFWFNPPKLKFLATSHHKNVSSSSSQIVINSRVLVLCVLLRLLELVCACKYHRQHRSAAVSIILSRAALSHASRYTWTRPHPVDNQSIGNWQRTSWDCSF